MMQRKHFSFVITMSAAVPSPLSHFDAQGQAHMVDVAAKAETHRVARASGVIRMLPATLALIESASAAVPFQCQPPTRTFRFEDFR